MNGYVRSTTRWAGGDAHRRHHGDALDLVVPAGKHQGPGALVGALRGSEGHSGGQHAIPVSCEPSVGPVDDGGRDRVARGDDVGSIEPLSGVILVGEDGPAGSGES